MDGRTHRPTDGSTDGRKDRGVVGHGQEERWVDDWVGGWTEGWLDDWVGGWTEGWLDEISDPFRMEPIRITSFVSPDYEVKDYGGRHP